MTTAPIIYEEAVARNLGLVSPEEQRALAQLRVGLPGLGGVGGIYSQTLVRFGVRRFHLADFDTFDVGNLQRQFCATAHTIGQPKAEVVERGILDVDPGAEVKRFDAGITEQSLDPFLDCVDVVLDGLEFFELPMRRRLFNRAYERGIPVITCAPLGFSAALLVFAPGGMRFDDYFDIDDDTPPLDALASFAVGLAPRPSHLKYLDLRHVDMTKRRGPAVAPSVVLCAAVACTELFRLCCGKGGLRPVPCYAQLDLLRCTWRRGRLRFGVRGPVPRLVRAVMLRRLRAQAKLLDAGDHAEEG